VANVRMEPLAKLVQLFRSRRRVRGQIGRAAAEVDMVDEHANDRLVLGRAAASECRQQVLILDSEVLPPFLIRASASLRQARGKFPPSAGAETCVGHGTPGNERPPAGPASAHKALTRGRRPRANAIWTPRATTGGRSPYGSVVLFGRLSRSSRTTAAPPATGLPTY
jgi:hypothetical protein